MKFVATLNPIQQGLKPQLEQRSNNTFQVATLNPIQQGLKHKSVLNNTRNVMQVATLNPIQQGLKRVLELR